MRSARQLAEALSQTHLPLSVIRDRFTGDSTAPPPNEMTAWGVPASSAIRSAMAWHSISRNPASPCVAKISGMVWPVFNSMKASESCQTDLVLCARSWPMVVFPEARKPIRKRHLCTAGYLQAWARRWFSKRVAVVCHTAQYLAALMDFLMTSRIRSTSGSFPVNSLNCCSACLTNISTPVTVTQSAARACLINSVCSGL